MTPTQIKQIRGSFTQKQMAHFIGIDLRQYRRIENGEQKPTKTQLKILHLFAAFFS